MTDADRSPVSLMDAVWAAARRVANDPSRENVEVLAEAIDAYDDLLGRMAAALGGDAG